MRDKTQTSLLPSVPSPLKPELRTITERRLSFPLPQGCSAQNMEQVETRLPLGFIFAVVGFYPDAGKSSLAPVEKERIVKQSA